MKRSDRGVPSRRAAAGEFERGGRIVTRTQSDHPWPHSEACQIGTNPGIHFSQLRHQFCTDGPETCCAHWQLLVVSKKKWAFDVSSIPITSICTILGLKIKDFDYFWRISPILTKIGEILQK